MRIWLWISSPAMTVAVAVEEQTVVEAPPIARKFVGQPCGNLIDWMNRQGKPGELRIGEI